jgi:hypothetical protein
VIGKRFSFRAERREKLSLKWILTILKVHSRIPKQEMFPKQAGGKNGYRPGLNL